MNRFFRSFQSFLVLAVLCVPALLLADDASGSDLPLLDFLRQLFDLGSSAGKVTGWAFAALVVKLLVDSLKTEFLKGLWEKLGPVGHRLAVLVLSALTVGVGAMATGANLLDALVATAQSAAGAMLLHELYTAVRDLIKKWFGV